MSPLPQWRKDILGGWQLWVYSGTCPSIAIGSVHLDKRARWRCRAGSSAAGMCYTVEDARARVERALNLPACEVIE